MTEEKIETRQDWNQGSFDKSSADSNDEDGNLKIGYPSPTSDVDTTMPKYNSIEAYYRLDEDTFNDDESVKDYSGNNLDGTVRNGMDSANGVFNTGAVQYDGDNDQEGHIHLVDSKDWFRSFVEQNEGAISVWVNLNSRTDAEGSPCSILQTRAADNEPPNNLLRVEDDPDELRWGLSMDDEWFTLIYSEETFPLNEWVHVVVTVENPDEGDPESRIYMDGDLKNSETFTETTTTDDWEFDFTIGASGDEGSDNLTGFLDGRLSELIVFNESLSDSEVEELYFQGQIDNDFKGDWSHTVVDEPSEQSWDNLDFTNHDINIPSGDDITCVVRSLDSEGNENDSKTLTLDETQDVYDISDLQDGHQLEVEFDMTVNQ